MIACTTAPRAARLDELLERSIVVGGVAPGASAAVAVRYEDRWLMATGAAGNLSVRPTPRVTPETPFDLASVTKSFIAVSAALLVQEGALAFEHPLGRWVDEARSSPSVGSRLELLLAHRAGLSAHLPLFEVLGRGGLVRRGAVLRGAALARRPEHLAEPTPAEGFPPVYSDMGYLLAGEMLARAAREALDQVVRSRVCEPLGLNVGSARQWLTRQPDFVRRVARTEHVAWRGGELAGVVHDENAWAFSGLATSGHAGLFGTAEDVARFGCAVLDAGRGDTPWLSQRALQPLLRRRPGGSLRAGFDGRSDVGSSAGARCSSETFGHLGFTGTSLWCDPQTQSVVVLLTNRVCPTRSNTRLRELRPTVHDALFDFAREQLGAARQPATVRPPG